MVREYRGARDRATFHASPHINHTYDPCDTTRFEAGVTFTVEPMLATGSPTFVQADDGRAEQLVDAMPSAQFEHTVL